MSDAERAAVLQALIALALQRVAMQADAFIARLAAALQAADAGEPGMQASLRLSEDRAAFQGLLLASLQGLLQREVRALDRPDPDELAHAAMDLSLGSFEAMQNKVALDNLSQAIDAANRQALDMLGRRIAHLLRRETIGLAHNPFRSALFLSAVSDALNKFDANAQNLSLMLRRLRPDTFLQLGPILEELNEALNARGIVPEAAGPQAVRLAQGGPATQERLHDLLGPVVPSHSSESSARLIHPALLACLNDMQRQQPAEGLPDTAILRQVRQQAPARLLSAYDSNAIELLAKVFEHIFQDERIPASIRKLLGRLQLLVLKAALADKGFFFSAEHPARRLIEALAQNGWACDPEKGDDDPLYRAFERIVDQAVQDCEQPLELFENMAAELDAALKKEERAPESKASEAIAQAKQQEKELDLQRQAEQDVAERIEAGDVAGFVASFLREQWVRALAMAYRMRESKPEALDHARKTMEELIWSVKLKASPNERKELVGKLPALLAQLGSWLDAIQWNGPERESFFARLAERHATVARTPLESMPRHQLEMAMNVAQKASESRFSKLASEASEQKGKTADEFVQRVNCLGRGSRVMFRDGLIYRLAWTNPRCSRFVFSARQAGQVMSLTADALAQAFRERQAAIVATDAVVSRALSVALEEFPR